MATSLKCVCLFNWKTFGGVYDESECKCLIENAKYIIAIETRRNRKRVSFYTSSFFVDECEQSSFFLACITYYIHHNKNHTHDIITTVHAACSMNDDDVVALRGDVQSNTCHPPPPQPMPLPPPSSLVRRSTSMCRLSLPLSTSVSSHQSALNKSK